MTLWHPVNTIWSNNLPSVLSASPSVAWEEHGDPDYSLTCPGPYAPGWRATGRGEKKNRHMTMNTCNSFTFSYLNKQQHGNETKIRPNFRSCAELKKTSAQELMKQQEVQIMHFDGSSKVVNSTYRVPAPLTCCSENCRGWVSLKRLFTLWGLKQRQHYH